MGLGGGCRWGVKRIFLAGLLAIVIAFSTVAAPPAGSQAEAMDSEEMTFLAMINQYRAANGLGALSLNSKLNDTALWMAQDLAAHSYFSHTDSLGRDPFQRMDNFGYDYNTWRGENLVAGTEMAQASMDMWKASPGHNANMLNVNYTVIGIARAYGPASPFGWYWATEFGGEADPAPPAEPPPPPPPAPAPPAPPTPPPAPAYIPTAAPVPAPPTDTPPPAPSPTSTPSAAPTPRFGLAVTPTPTATPAATAVHWWQIGRILGERSQRFDAVRSRGSDSYRAFRFGSHAGVLAGLMVHTP